MATAFRLKTFPEILAGMMARARRLIKSGTDIDLNVASVIRTIIELAAMSDADIYIQIAKLLRFFSIDNTKGDDLDRRALDIGAFFFKPLRRNKASPSVVKISIGDGTLVALARLDVDVTASSTSFTVAVGDGEKFPSSGSAYLERGTVRQERVVYVRVGDTFTVAAGLAFSHAAYGEVVRIATQSSLATLATIGATSISLQANTGAAWPASGTVVLDRGTVSEERKTFTRLGDTLTLGAGLTFGHSAGVSAILSTTGSNRTFSSGNQVFVPASESSRQVSFRTLATATLLDGDFTSDLVDAQCLVVGADTNVGANTCTKFATSPFSGATVTNPLPAAGGANSELDDAYLARIKNFTASQTRGTPLALETLVMGLKDETTNSFVAFAEVVEPVAPGLSQLYISDGSANFSISQQVFSGKDVAISNATLGDRRGSLHQAAPYRKQASPIAERTPRVFASVQRGTSTSVGANFLEDTTQNMVVNAYTGMYLKASDDQFYLIASNTAIRFVLSASGATPSVGNYAVLDLDSHASISSSSTSVAADTLTDAVQTMTVNAFVGYYLLDSADGLYLITANSATAFTLNASGVTPAAGAYKVLFSTRSLPLVPDVDFNFNESNGELELAASLVQYDAVVAASNGASPSVGAYTYSTGLGAFVQRKVNGDPTDFDNFPGLRCAGSKVLLAAPTVVSPFYVISVVPKSGVSISQLEFLVQLTVETYVNSLGMSVDPIKSEIIRLVKGLPGVADVVVVSPESNVSVGDGQMARISGTVNVQVI